MTPFELKEEEEERASDTAALTRRADGRTRTVGEVGTSKWTLVTECN